MTNWKEAVMNKDAVRRVLTKGLIPGLRWTTEKPTIAGHYWVRSRMSRWVGDGIPLERYGEELTDIVKIGDRNGRIETEGFHRAYNHSVDGIEFFAGPIPIPQNEELRQEPL